MPESPRTPFETIKVEGQQLVARVREVIKEGEAQRLIIRKDEHVYMEIPMSYGIGGAMAAIWLAPTLAAVGALAALVTDVELVIERQGGQTETELIETTVIDEEADA